MPAVLALGWYADGATPGEPVMICGTCAMGQKTAQNAGKAFWEKFERPLCPETTKLSRNADKEEEKVEDMDAAAKREAAYKEKQAKRDAKRRASDGGLLKISDDLKGKDLYELLDCEASASSEDIKKAFKKMALVYHPDKMTDPTDEQKNRFLLIQDAFDILSDPMKRRRFESTLKFDDDIPTDTRKGYKDNFFETFAPVFKRNARWSSKPRVPELGDEDTPIETVKAFYEFWRNFDSWRDPLAIAEADEVDLHNLEEAESRDEKRWMERENAKVARKIEKLERERISDLTKFSDRHDPRMIAHRAEVAAGKEAAKEAKAAAAVASAERKTVELQEAAEAAETIRLLHEGQRLAEKKTKDEAKNVVKTARQRVRNLHKNAAPLVRRSVHVDQLQEVCLRLGADELSKLASELEDAMSKEKGDCCETVALLHAEIKKYGGTPIEDDSVQLKPDVDSESTATPDDCEPSPRELEGSPLAVKSIKIPTPEEVEAERKVAEADEAEERVKREKKAEEQRKKREQKKREDEKRDAASNRAEAAKRSKERKATAKESEKAVAKETEETTVVAKARPISDISKNVILVVIEEGTVFASTDSSEEISEICEGSFLVAAGPPVDVDGFAMVPLQPCGSVELRIVKRMLALDSSVAVAAPVEVAAEVPVAKTTSKGAGKQPVEEDLDDLLNEFGLTPQPAVKSPKKKGKK